MLENVTTKQELMVGIILFLLGLAMHVAGYSEC